MGKEHDEASLFSGKLRTLRHVALHFAQNQYDQSCMGLCIVYLTHTVKKELLYITYSLPSAYHGPAQHYQQAAINLDFGSCFCNFLAMETQTRFLKFMHLLLDRNSPVVKLNKIRFKHWSHNGAHHG